MNAEEALKLFNELMYEKTKATLNEVEECVFIGIWEGKKYYEMNPEYSADSEYPKEVGSKLFKKIKANWDINISKKNFKSSIKLLFDKDLEAKQNSLSQPTATQVDCLQILNPFFPLTGKINNPQLFFNRDKERRRIFATLNSGSSVAVIGESKIGKSSLLLAIEREAKTRLQTRQPIYLDLQTIRNEEHFYTRLCQEAKIKKSNKIEDVLDSLSKHRLLLLLDEVEKMNRDGFTNNIRSELRGLAEGMGGSTPLRLVVAARTPLDILFPDTPEETSPLNSICIQEKINPWNDETMRSFIESRLNSSLLEAGAKSVSFFTKEEIARVIEESGGHPQKLMQLCHDIYQNYLEE